MRTPYTTCVDGHVRNMELDDWCCPDQTTKETSGIVGDTTEPCGDGPAIPEGTTDADAGGADAAPACGKPGSDCDQTACGKKGGNCTTRAGGCICEIRFGGCGFRTHSCYDSGCAQKGGTCQLYEDIAECVCVAN
jgi:hypothetical protein